MKRKSYLIAILVVILLSGGWNMVYGDKDSEARKLIDKAAYHYGLLEEYPGALKYLEQAMEITTNPRIQAIAMVKTAYVYYLMKKGIDKFKPYIVSALALNPALKLDTISYKRSFIRVFNAMRSNAGSSNTMDRSELDGDDEGWEDDYYKKFFIQGGVSYLLHADSRYKDIYNSGQIYPRFSLGYRLGRVIYLWAGYGFLSAKGTIPVFELDASSSQSFLTFGAGFMGNFSKKLSYKMGFGLLLANFKEEAFDQEVKGNTNGFEIDGGVMFDLGTSLYLEASFGYLSAGESASGLNAKIGGLRSGLSLGFKF